MTKHIQAYFRTEDQAESARTSVSTYDVKNLEVGRLDKQISQGSRVMVPLLPLNAGAGGVTGNSAGVSGGAGPGTIIPPTAIIDNDGKRNEVTDDDSAASHDNDDTDAWSAINATDKDYDDLKYVLSATVMESDVENVVQKLRTNNAFVEILE
ncbi:hypothetical protein [Paenibacillus wulumuqiensis]|uniref:hypothetical protein n=1 Tax=Paenibacillus wulumuqiensis TaxID=1567107 RepID=UPI000619FFF5|nr:hypothetical protein [Paenibacillus wulumuqiensis]